MGQGLIRACRIALFNYSLKRGVAFAALLVAGLAAGLSGTQARAAGVESWHLFFPEASPQVEPPGGPGILGTIALPIRAKPTSTRWSKLMLASINQPALARLTESAWGLPPEEQAAWVQAAVNHAIRTGPASYDCSDDGYWAPASETLARGKGDCIDVAITKMEALRFLGFAGADMFLTTGRFRSGGSTQGGRETAALLVRIGEQYWLLPEQDEPIIQADSSREELSPFTPVMTYGVGSTWVHGRLVKFASVGN